MSDLIKQLQEDAEWNSAPQLNDPAIMKTAALEREAAKHISELEAERDAMKAQLDCIMKWATEEQEDPQTDFDEGYDAAQRWVLEVGLCAMPEPSTAKEQQ